MDLKINNESVIVFDLDDTLYNEIDFLKSSYLEIAKKMDLKNHEQLYARMFGMYRNKINVFEYLSKTYTIPIAELLNAYRSHIPNIKLFDYAHDFMLQIKKHSGRIAIITDGRSITQRNKIKKLGLEPFLDYLIISEEIGFEKPNSINYLSIENYFKAKNYTYIADNLKKDFIAPNQLGWNSIGKIDNGKNIHKVDDDYYVNKKHVPNHFIQCFSEINIID